MLDVIVIFELPKFVSKTKMQSKIASGHGFWWIDETRSARRYSSHVLTML